MHPSTHARAPPTFPASGTRDPSTYEQEESVNTTKTEAPRISDVVSNELWPGIARMRPEDLNEQDFVIHEVRFLNGEYGEYAVARCTDPSSGNEFTCALSGQVVVRKLRELEGKSGFPVTARRVKKERYWDLE
jgi:DNA-binding cell septation regulator SpoVG